ncbi:hypothetical protein ABPG72_000409 [Tetrahymena utriculariae]
MYQNQVNNLNRITAYYGYPSNNKNSNTQNYGDSNNTSLYSVKKTGDDTLNKSWSSPKSPNTSEILIQNIGGKVGDLSKEVSRLMQINDKLIADISALNSQNQNKDFLIKSLQERLSLAGCSSSRQVQNANQQQMVDYNEHQINNSKAQEKEEEFQSQITNINTIQPRSGISPNLYVNNMLNPNQIKNVTNFDSKEDNQRYLLSSLQVNTDVAENTTNFLFNSGFSQSGKNSAKHAQQVQQKSYEKINGYNSNETNNITSPWSLYQQDEKVNQIQMNDPSFSYNNANNNNVNYQVINDQKNTRNSQQNKMLMLASFQDKQSASSEQANNLQSQFSLFQEELESVKREKAQLEMNYNDLKQKYEDQQKEHAREIAQLKTNMFNSVVESDNYSKYDEDPFFNIENIKKTFEKNNSELIKSIEVDEKIIEGRFNKKDNANIFNNNSFSASKEQFMQKSITSNKIQGVSDHQTNLVVSQEIPSNKNLDKMGPSQQNIVASNELQKNDLKSNQEQFIKRNSLKQGTLNGANLHKDNNAHLIDILDQLEQAKKENTNLKYELKLVKEELLFISAKDTQAHSKNEQLRIIAAKFKLEQEEEIMKFRIQNEELQSELKKLNSLNKNLQNEILKLKDGLQSHQRSSTLMDEKTLENLFDSEIESEGEDLEDDGYGDRDSKQIRKHKNDILNTMTNNEKIYNKIVYLKRKNRRLEDQLEEWKRQYWLLEKSTQNNNYQSQNNNKNINTKKPNSNNNNNNNQNNPPQLIQQNSQGPNQEKPSLFEFNFSQFLQYQQRASQESKKQAQQVQLPQVMNEINENAENVQKENKLDSSTFSKNEAISQCDTPAIGISVNQGKAEQITPQMNYCTPSNEVTNSKSNKSNLINYTNISNLIMNQQQNNVQQEKSASQQLPKQNDFNNISPKSANLNNNKNNFSNEQFYKQTSFSNYNPYSLNSNYQIQKIDQYLYKPVTQFSPSQKSSNQTPNQNDQINNQIHQIKEEKKQLEKGVISTIKDIRDQVNQLQKRKSKNAPQSQSHQQQVINQITKYNSKLQVQQQHTSSQKIFNDQHYQNKIINSDQQKQQQSTSGLIHLEQRTTNSTTKISDLINNFKKLNLEKSQSPITSDQKSNILNYTSINSNNTSQNIGNFTCQTDRQILYNNSSQNNVQSQPSLNNINQYQLTAQQKNLNKIAQTVATTPKMSNTKQSPSVHYAQNNQQSQQYQQIKQVLHTQPNVSTNQEKNTFNNRQSANLSYETTKSQMNNLSKSTSPIISTKSYPKQIEQSYSSNFIYQKTKFNQRIKDKYN